MARDTWAKKFYTRGVASQDYGDNCILGAGCLHCRKLQKMCRQPFLEYCTEQRVRDVSLFRNKGKIMSGEKVDRRQYIRLPKNYSVEISAFCFPLNSQPKFLAKSADISAGGMRIEAPTRYNEGDKVQIKVCVPCLNKFMPGFFKVYENDAEQYLQTIAEIVRVENGMSSDSQILGLRFIDLAEDSLIALKKMVEKSIQGSER